MSTMAKTPHTSKSCPICGKPTADKFQPFCSQRCTNVDLNRWLTGVYAVPAVDEDAAEDIELPEPGADSGNDR